VEKFVTTGGLAAAARCQPRWSDGGIVNLTDFRGGQSPVVYANVFKLAMESIPKSLETVFFPPMTKDPVVLANVPAAFALPTSTLSM